MHVKAQTDWFVHCGLLEYNGDYLPAHAKLLGGQ